MNARILIWILLPVTLICSCQRSSDQQTADEGNTHVHEQPDSTGDDARKPLSPHTAAMANIGDTHVHIDYSSPGVRDRVIWGGLVAYDQIWVAGAHQATWIEFDGDVEVNGEPVTEGKYALFLIPGKEEWTIVLNENHDQHLTDEYDPELDVCRFTLVPQRIEPLQESLTWKVLPGEGNTGEVVFMWEHIKLSFPVTAV